MSRLIKFTILSVITVSLSLFLIISAVWLVIPDPGLYPLKTDSTAIFDSRDRLIRLTLNPDQSYRLFNTLSEIPDDFIRATLIYEDRFYYYHPGFNPFSIIRAVVGIISGSRPVGASTVSMQTARMRFNLKTRTFSGKLVQIFRAIQLERHYSKDQILEAYFNLAPYGRNIEGIGAASLIYFGKKPKALTFPEALVLSVIPQNPGGRCPLSVDGYKKMDAARQELFMRLSSSMPEHYKKYSGFIKLKLFCASPEILPFKAPHFTDYVLSRIGDYRTDDITGKGGCDGFPEDISSGSQSGCQNKSASTIKTSLDSEIQTGIENIISKHIRTRYVEGIRNAAALLVDSETMKIIAMAGSADFFDRSIYGQVNAVTSKRSPGSALKPFVYGLAIDQGLIHPRTLLKDTPLRYGAYSPENFDRTFQGPLSATEALNQSRNVPAVSLAARLTSPDFYDFLKLAGISGMKEKAFYGLSPVLGGCEVSMMEMAELYAMLANGGIMKTVGFTGDRSKSDSVDTVYDSGSSSVSGFTSVSDSYSASGQRLLSPEACYLVLDMLLKNSSSENDSDDSVSEDGSSGDSFNKGKPLVAWKTGTSWGFRDAWTAGVAGRYILVVWIGNFRGEGNPAFVGRTAAAPVFFDIIHFLRQKSDLSHHPGPSLSRLNLKKTDVCALSGALPNRYTPKTVKTWFIPGKSPITVSDVHRAVPVDIKTGLRACVHNPPYTRLEVFEFWESDISRVFHEAGIFRPEPPPYMKECGLDQRNDSGKPPVIISPDSFVTYVIRKSASAVSGLDRIPLEATSENGVETLYWFADNAFIGSSAPGEMILWQAPSGEYRIRVVDDNGRSATNKLTVNRE